MKNHRICLILVTTGLFFLLSSPIYGANITVTGSCSLALAIMSANADTSVGTCAAGSGSDTIVLTYNVELKSYNNNDGSEFTGLPVVTSNIIINGNGYSIKRSSAENTPSFRIMKIVGGGVECRLQNISIENGYNVYRSYGSGIYVADSATLFLENASIVNNTDDNSGVIRVDHGTLIVNNSHIDNNIGRGITAIYSDVHISGSTISNNQHPVEWGGGPYGIKIESGSLFVSSSIISKNEQGGIKAEHSDVTIEDSHITNNIYSGGCVGIYFREYSSNSTRNFILDNSTVAFNEGRGILLDTDDTVTINNSSIHHNATNGLVAGGGGIDIDCETYNITNVFIENTSIRYNTATQLSGGGMRMNGCVAWMHKIDVSNNTSSFSSGGGLKFSGQDSSSKSYLIDSTISSNSSGTGAGGLSIGSYVELTNVTISGNKAHQKSYADGGGVYIGGTEDITLNHVTIANNTAIDAGGGLYINESSGVTLNHCLISGNHAGASNEIYVKNNDGAGTLAGSYNLIGQHNDPSAANFYPGSTDIIPAQGLSDIINPLAYNGGRTKTHALVDDSPALDAVSVGCPPPATDQRGFARPINGKCDIGAYEGSEPKYIPPFFWPMFLPAIIGGK